MDIQTDSSSSKLMASPKRSPRSTSRKKCICLSVTAAVLGLGLLFLILGLTVFKAKHPTTTINSIALENLQVSLDMASLTVLLNVSLAVNVSVTNPNRVGFRYDDAVAILRHRGRDVGSVPVPAGRIGADDTKSMNLTLTLNGNRLLSDSSLYSDVLSGTLPFQTYIRISGKVRLIFKIHVVAETTCNFDINIGNQTVSNTQCQYKTKL